MTPVDDEAPTLKKKGTALDSDRAMQVQEIKRRVQRSDYVVDPPTVAAAMLRHAVSQRRWWNPRKVCGAPPALMTTCGGPSSTVPIQVSGTAASTASRPAQTHSS
ncbi:MAG: hypothetical protein QOE11_2251 [Solirubrobacteraceae bacterium]|nr:hypothetical protein [Solirubrobacteraceae bacterium]